MSNLELGLFYLLDWSDDVVDIREQYPLTDLNKAIELTEKAGIKYPYDPKSGFPYVMTSDFLLETRHEVKVLSVKHSSELNKPRVREKLEIERRYWNQQGIVWNIVTEREINQIKAKNIEWLAQAKDLEIFGIFGAIKNACIEYFLESYCSDSALLPFLAEVENEFDFIPGIGLNIYKHLAYWKRIAFNADERVDFSTFLNNPKLHFVGGKV